MLFTTKSVLALPGTHRTHARPTNYTTATTPPVLIAIASWDCPLVKVLSWPPLPTRDSHAGPNQRTGLPDGSALAEVATWHPPWEVQVGADGEQNQAVADLAADREREGTTLTRSLAFVWAGDSPRRLSLVAATAGGAVAVAGWCTRGCFEEEGQGQENAGEGGRTAEGWLRKDQAGKLVTSASFQIGHGSTRLEVFSGGEGGGEDEKGKDCHDICTSGERVFINGTRNAVLHCRRPDGERSRAWGPDMWRCIQVRPTETTKLKRSNGGCVSVRRLQVQNLQTIYWLVRVDSIYCPYPPPRP